MTASWLPGVISLAIVLVLMAWIVLACKMPGRPRRAGREHLRAPLRSRIRAQLREILGTRYPIPRDGEPLTELEQRTFNGCVLAENGPLADEPQRERGTQQ